MDHPSTEALPPEKPRSSTFWLAAIAAVLLGAGLLGFAAARRNAAPAPGGAVVGDAGLGAIETPSPARPPGATGQARDSSGAPAGISAVPPMGEVSARATPDLALPPPAFDGEPATERIEFQPAMPEGEPRTGGSCEREALVAPRADAFHCLLEGQPYDPCYRVEGDDKLVICNARPTNESGAFLLRLVVSPPANRVTAPPDEPWVLDLGDTVCEKRLGLQLVTFGDKPIRYDCRDGSLVIDLVRNGPAWAVQRVVIRIDGAPVADRADWVPVRRAWW